MHWFGKDADGDPADEIDAPVGMACCWCEEPIAPGDSGVTMPLVAAHTVGTAVYHQECFMRTVVGSVGHQLKLCSCYRGADASEDCEPPEQSKREQAKAAWTLYQEQATRP